MELLRLWQNIHQEASDLASAVEQLPDECECGDANSHLGGKCPCCRGHMMGGNPDDGQNCLSIISSLQADLTVLGQDLSIAGPALGAAALETQQVELRRGLFLAVGDLEAILEAFRRVTESVVGFRQECTILRMRTVKRRCVEFRAHCDRVNAELLNQRLRAG